MYYLILKQPVSGGESKPGPPNHNLSRPGILRPKRHKKGALTSFNFSFSSLNPLMVRALRIAHPCHSCVLSHLIGVFFFLSHPLSHFDACSL